MNKSSTHIISKFRWDTVFDSRDRAFELQERLSDWSRTHLQREAATIFNRLCPPDQSWKIGQLEIDLGVIDFNNLEAELTEKIGRCLAEQLIDMVIYANNDGSNIDVTSADISSIEILCSFLMYGVLPWNSRMVDISVNELLSEQLRINFRNLIAQLREMGATSKEVRKRMAWQFNEPNLVKILEGLEPNHHEQILDFTNELAVVQGKETIVQAGSADFRKNLWFWVLNYLYAERGSVFNRISFMKSSIRQMADHYNIGYDDLFAMIEAAVVKINAYSTVNAGFVVILQELVKEKQSTWTEDHILPEEKDYWDILEHLFKGNPVPGYSSAETLNELVINLSHHDSQRFSQLMASLSLSQNAWAGIARSLKDASLEAIVYALNTERSGFIMESIYFLIKLSRDQHIGIDKPLLWAYGIRNLKQNKDAATGDRLFIMDCILCLSKTNQVPWEKMLLQLIGAPVPSSGKTAKALDVLTALTDVFLIEISNRPPSFFNNRFVELVGSFYDLLEQADPNHEKMITLQQSLRKYMRLYPSGALELLVQHTGREKMTKLFLSLIDNHTAGLLLQHAAAGSYYPALVSLQKQLKKFGETRPSAQMILFVENHLMNIGLRLAVLFPGAGSQEFLEKLFKELLLVMPDSLQKDFRAFIARLHSEGIFEKARYTLVFDKEQFFMEQVNVLILQGPLKRAEVTSLLRRKFLDQDFVSIRKSGEAKAVALLDYLVDGAAKIMDQLIVYYEQILIAHRVSVTREELVPCLKELFWKCLLDSSYHRGELKRLQKVFKHSVYVNYPMKESKEMSADLTIENLKPTTNSDGPSYSEILRMLKACFENCETTIDHHGRQISIEELISLVMDRDTKAVCRIISGLPFSDKASGFIGSVLSFSELIDSMTGTEDESVSLAMEDMKLLFHLAATCDIDNAQQTHDQAFIKEAVTLLATGDWSVKQMTRQVLSAGIPVGQIVSLVKDHGFVPSPVMRSEMISQMPELVELLAEAVLNKGKERIKKLHGKGLLDQLIRSLLKYRQVPFWFAESGNEEAADLLNEIIIHHPSVFLRVIKRENITEQQVSWLEMSISTEELFRSIGRLHGDKRSLIRTVYELYKSFVNVSIKGISGHALQALLFNRIIHAWISGNWEMLSSTDIWNGLAWDSCLKTGLTKTDFLLGISQYKSLFPVSLQVSMEQYAAAELTIPELRKPMSSPKPFKRPRLNTVTEPALGEGITVKNAGLVILNSYIPLLFERMGIVSDGKFTGASAQNDAAHYLQYLVTGTSSTEEFLLPLNKILCGLDLSEPVTDCVMLTVDQEEMMDGLLYGVINHWPDAGSNTADGLRGNWLVRNGILRKEEAGWELTVERKSYDLLLGRAPFSFSLIKFPWMPKPLNVKWRL